MVVLGPWSEAIEKKAQKKGIKELELNHAKGWKGRDLSFLPGLCHLLAFEIIDWKIDDVSPIHNLRFLKSLDVNTYCESEIDFSCFPELEEVSLEWRDKAQSLLNCTSLKKVFINNYAGKSLEDFSKLRNLRHLSLKSPKIENIGNVYSLEKLKFLELGNARKLKSLVGIEKLDSLKTLELNRCRNIHNIEPVRYLYHLRRFFLVDCKQIESLKPIEELNNLEEICFYDSTNIVDGDLSPLKELPNLKDIYFQDFRHYNYRMEDFNPGHDEELRKVLKQYCGTSPRKSVNGL